MAVAIHAPTVAVMLTVCSVGHLPWAGAHSVIITCAKHATVTRVLTKLSKETARTLTLNLVATAVTWRL